MLTHQERLLLHHLSQFPTDHKKECVEHVLNARTRYVTVVLEDIYQSQNASAVIRTCECMGLQDIYIVENTTTYDINRRVLKGSEKWVTLHKHKDKGVDNTENAFKELKSKGYTILGADPSETGISIDEIKVDENPIALVFGNELRGISESTMNMCDKIIKIPMYGFTESLNISVSVAITLQSILTRLRKSSVDFLLSESEKEILRLNWYRKIVHRSDIVEREFMRTIA